MRTRLTSSSHSVPRSDGAHRPVLLHEVLHALDIQSGDIVLDATLGGGGHAKELLKGLGGNGLFIGFDADQEAVERVQNIFTDSQTKSHLICSNFRDIGKELAARQIPHITKALFDLGWSSYQLDSGRGFSFLRDEPLRMTYQKPARPATGRSGGDAEALTAEVAINTWAESSLADVIYGFGEERYARRIAKAIVERRQKRLFTTSGDLAEVVRSAVPAPYRRGRIHPATRTFQALRMAVNDELGALKDGLRAAWIGLASGGRIAVISFHSIEDRIVKHMFAEWVKSGEGTLLAKKPLTASREEVVENPRARSAKLRVIQKGGEKISHESKNTKNKQVRPVDFSGET